MPVKISKNQKVAETKNKPKERVAQWDNVLCGHCGAKSRRVRPKMRKCENGHTFMKKNG